MTLSGGTSPVGDLPITDLKGRLKMVEFKVVEQSQLPVRMYKKRNGVCLGSFETREKAEAHLVKLHETEFTSKVKRGKQGNTRRR